MKKIANFTQTYRTIPEYTWGADSENREFLFDFLLKDKVNIWFRSKLDFHNISFHNYETEDAKKIVQKVQTVLPDTAGFVYNNMTYAQSFFEHLKILKYEHQITDVCWIQDDEFFIYSNLADIEDFIKYYRNDSTLTNVVLGTGKSVLDYTLSRQNMTTADTNGEHITDTLILYRTNCTDFFNFDKHPFGSGACICNIDILLDIFENFGDHIKTNNAYHVEEYMGTIGLQKNLQRCILNVPFIKPYNIVGMGGSLGSAEKNLQDLNTRL